MSNYRGLSLPQSLCFFFLFSFFKYMFPFQLISHVRLCVHFSFSLLLHPPTLSLGVLRWKIESKVGVNWRVW